MVSLSDESSTVAPRHQITTVGRKRPHSEFGDELADTPQRPRKTLRQLPLNTCAPQHHAPPLMWDKSDPNEKVLNNEYAKDDEKQEEEENLTTTPLMRLEMLTDWWTDVSAPDTNCGPFRNRVDLFAQQALTLYCIQYIPPTTVPHSYLVSPVGEAWGEPAKPTLVLDLDQTLILSINEDEVQDHNRHIFGNCGYRLNPNTCDGLILHKRPYVDEFLASVYEDWELVFWTAGKKEYALECLKILDPENKLFTATLFREHCSDTYLQELDCYPAEAKRVVDGFDPGCFLCLKPLNRIARETVFILDDAAEAYALNHDRCLPIRGWKGNRDDHALKDLIPFFRDLARLPSRAEMRHFVKDYYGLGDILGTNRILCPVTHPVVEEVHEEEYMSECGDSEALPGSSSDGEEGLEQHHMAHKNPIPENSHTDLRTRLMLEQDELSLADTSDDNYDVVLYDPNNDEEEETTRMTVAKRGRKAVWLTTT